MSVGEVDDTLMGWLGVRTATLTHFQVEGVVGDICHSFIGSPDCSVLDSITPESSLDESSSCSSTIEGIFFHIFESLG